MIAGRVKWWDDLRGIGYVTGDDGTDYFVHHTEIALSGPGRRTLVTDEPVEFEPHTTPKGPRARSVTPRRRPESPARDFPPPTQSPEETWPPADDLPDEP